MAFTNGDFETGDLTGWTKYEDSGTATVTTGSKQSGTYGCNVTITTEDTGEGEVSIRQTISSSFTAITIPFKVAAYSVPVPPVLRCMIAISVLDSGDVQKYIWPLGTSGYVTITSTSDWANIVITKSEVEAKFAAGDHWDTTTEIYIIFLVVWG